jgi:hypothetical protein
VICHSAPIEATSIQVQVNMAKIREAMSVGLSKQLHMSPLEDMDKPQVDLRYSIEDMGMLLTQGAVF